MAAVPTPLVDALAGRTEGFAPPAGCCAGGGADDGAGLGFCDWGGGGRGDGDGDGDSEGQTTIARFGPSSIHSLTKPEQDAEKEPASPGVPPKKLPAMHCPLEKAMLDPQEVQLTDEQRVREPPVPEGWQSTRKDVAPETWHTPAAKGRGEEGYGGGMG
jgi:hypothetical protein